MEEGRYTCLIPSRYVHVLCLPPGTSQGPEATLAVDDLKVRVILMEAEQRSLRADNRQLTAENQRLAQNVSALQHDNQRLAQNLLTLQQDNQDLKTDNRHFTQNLASLQQHVQQLEAESQQVSAFIQGKWHEHMIRVALLYICHSVITLMYILCTVSI